MEKFKREKALNGLIGALQARRDAAAARAGEVGGGVGTGAVVSQLGRVEADWSS